MSVGFLRNARRRPPREVSPALRIGGFTGLSCTDYPGLLSAVVFCQGCPWRCSYCHNPHLQAPFAATPIAWRNVERFLERRRGLLDAVVFSGGEPTLQSGVADAMRAAKQMGFRVGLHTAGIYPRRLETLLPLTDWVGMDIKAPFAEYSRNCWRSSACATTCCRNFAPRVVPARDCRTPPRISPIRSSIRWRRCFPRSRSAGPEFRRHAGFHLCVIS
jgi:anaerobic ribonucleoside-triphosphate reductase activating protein